MKAEWGTDPLSEHIQIIFDNSRASYRQYQTHYKSLMDVHNMFSRVVHDFTDPMASIAPILVARSHASFLAAVILGLAGHVPECYMLLRGCIENSLYSFYLRKHTNLEDVWTKRHSGDAEMKDCKKNFQMGKILRSLEESDAMAHKYVSSLYNCTIDLGAHPNMMSVYGMMEKGKGQSIFEFAYLTNNKVVLQSCLKNATRTGLSALMLYCVAYSDQFDVSALRKDIARVDKILMRHKKLK